jgi:hypothetical protein
MPSFEHEVMVELLRDGELVRVLLAVGGVTAEGAAHVADATLTTPEIRADVVVLFGDEQTRLAVVVEVQRSRDVQKQWVWPLYEAAARARHKCEACVFVFAADDTVAAWARKSWRIGPMSSFRAIVIGPDDVPAITEERYARRFPSLAVLSAFAHAHDDKALGIARAALTGLESMHEDRRGVYFDLILQARDEAARRELEAWMDFKNYEYKSDFAKKNFVAGIAEGEIASSRTALFDVLRARGFHVDDASRSRIEACRDVALLRTWVSRAAVADVTRPFFDL